MIIRVIFNPVKAKASIYQMKHGFANEAVRATEIRQGTFFFKNSTFTGISSTICSMLYL